MYEDQLVCLHTRLLIVNMRRRGGGRKERRRERRKELRREIYICKGLQQNVHIYISTVKDSITLFLASRIR